MRIQQKLGFPERPKRPANAFIRYLKDVRSTLKNTDNLPQTKINVEIAARWRAEDDAKKQLYIQQYKTEIVHKSLR